MLKGILYTILIFFLASCVTTGSPEQRALPGRIHIVRRGETILKIASRYRVPLKELMEENGIPASMKITQGQIIFVPDSDPLDTLLGYPKRSTANLPRKQTAQSAPPIKLLWPVRNAKVLRSYSSDPKNPYEGIGLSAPRGAKVVAAADGDILYSGNDGTRYGLVVIVRHKNPYVTVYAHLDRSLHKKGDRVKQGEVIGEVGKSGGVESPRIHFQLRRDRRPVNPEPYLN